MEPLYHYHYGTSRTFYARLLNDGTLEVKRGGNLERMRYMHCQVNCWDGQHNKVFVIGGQHNTKVANTVETYDFKKKKWVLKSSMKSPRSVFSVTHVDNYIYAFGGFKDEQFYFADPFFERYSIQNDTWEPLAFDIDSLSSKLGVVINRTNDNNILILGGVNNETGQQTLQKYSPNNGKVIQLNADGLNGVMAIKFVTANGKVFRSIGGVNEFRLIEYNEDSDNWSPMNNEDQILSYLDQLNTYTKNDYQHVFSLINYSTTVSHNFY